MFGFIARGIGIIVMGLILLGLALVFWPITIILIVLGIACRLATIGKYQPRNKHGWQPLKKRRIWAADGYWYTTDGHPYDPIAIGPFPTRGHAQRYVDGEHFMADDEGLFSISMS